MGPTKSWSHEEWMDGNRMEFWFHSVELLIALLVLFTCGNLKRNYHRYITFSVIHEINTLRFYCVRVCATHVGCLEGWTRLQWWVTFEQYLNLKLEECIYYYYYYRQWGQDIIELCRRYGVSHHVLHIFVESFPKEALGDMTDSTFDAHVPWGWFYMASTPKTTASPQSSECIWTPVQTVR